MKHSIITFLLLLLLHQSFCQSTQLSKNFSGWYTYLTDHGKNDDPDRVFQIENGMLHISGQSFGYLASEKSYANFHFTAEFKWGEKKYPPRENEKRDNGICYYVPLEMPDKVWPLSVEFQVQEGDCGDFWLIEGSTIIVNGERTVSKDYQRVPKILDAEKPTGEWNIIEIIAKDGKLIHKINGVIVNQGTECSEHSGRILIQSEGAEIFYRSIAIEEI